MDPLIGSILAEQARWLVARCRGIAVKLVAPRQASDWKSVEALTEELNQAVLDRFVRRAHSGWFAEVPYVSREAQVRVLLGFCLRQEQKVRFAQLAKDRRTTSVWHDAEEDTDLDAVDTLADGTNEPPSDTIQRREHMEGLLRALPRISHPVRKLVAVALHRPNDVRSEDIVAAARHSAGGKRFLLRDPAEAWQMFQQALAAPEADDATWWRRRLAEIFRFSLPVAELEMGQVDLAVNALEKQLERATDDLKALLREDGIEVD